MRQISFETHIESGEVEFDVGMKGCEALDRDLSFVNALKPLSLSRFMYHLSLLKKLFNCLNCIAT